MTLGLYFIGVAAFACILAVILTRRAFIEKPPELYEPALLRYREEIDQLRARVLMLEDALRQGHQDLAGRMIAVSERMIEIEGRQHSSRHERAVRGHRVAEYTEPLSGALTPLGEYLRACDRLGVSVTGLQESVKGFGEAVRKEPESWESRVEDSPQRILIPKYDRVSEGYLPEKEV